MRLRARLSAHALPIAPPATTQPATLQKFHTFPTNPRRCRNDAGGRAPVVGAFTGGGSVFIAADLPLPQLRAHATLCVWHVARGSPFASHSRPFVSARPVLRTFAVEVAVGDRGERWDRSAVHRRASVHICVVSSACAAMKPSKSCRVLV